MVKIATAIIFFEKADLTIKCVRSVLPSGVNIYVLNNGSSTESTARLERFCRKYPQIRIINSATNVGPAKGRNMLVDAVKEEWVLFLDNDAYMKTKDWKRRLLQHVRDYPGIMVFLPKLYNVHHGNYAEFKSYRIENGIAYHDMAISNEQTNVFPEGAVFVRKEFFAVHGKYDEALFAFEGYELAIRSILNGNPIKAVLIDDIEIFHEHRFARREQDKTAVAVRYDQNAHKKSYERIVEKHDISLVSDGLAWVGEQHKIISKRGNPMKDVVWRRWTPRKMKKAIRKIRRKLRGGK